MAAIINGSTRLNIWVKINKQLAQALINLGTNKVYITLAYTKHWGFALKPQRNLYSLYMVNKTPTAHNRGIVDQETFKLKLRLRLYRELILFNITNIRDSNVILEFS